jgi:hypothetical protein
LRSHAPQDDINARLTSFVMMATQCTAYQRTSGTCVPIGYTLTQRSLKFNKPMFRRKRCGHPRDTFSQ